MFRTVLMGLLNLRAPWLPGQADLCVKTVFAIPCLSLPFSIKLIIVKWSVRYSYHY